MLRAFVLPLAAAAALALAGPAAAQDPPPEPPPEPVIAAGVTVAGVPVGGLTGAEAAEALQAFFDQRLSVTFGSTVRVVAPWRLGARARVAAAVQEALVALPDTALTLRTVIRGSVVKAWVKRRAKQYDRDPRDTRARLSHGVPRLTKARLGREVKRKPARARLLAALRAHRRDVVVPVKTLEPRITPRTHGPAVVIRRGSKRLVLYRGSRPGPMRAVRYFPIATGMAAYPTPLGSFRIVTMQRNPWWYPPKAGWASGAQPIPPGPGNPLGTRWMGLNVGAVGIHGTPDAASIGYSA
ncbi:MAG TPA: L,D-transpeptidase, partial [Gaiellaceae bacterium]|nr:L,D-transpeptidase [Gaiellaceae bacterium]